MDEYDLEIFIMKITGLSLVEVHVSLQKELLKIHNIRSIIKTDKIPYALEQYYEHLGDFLFFIEHQRIPKGIGKKGILKFLPVIEYIASHGQQMDAYLQLLK